MKTTKQQNNKTTKQQNNKTTKQQNNKTTKQFKQFGLFMIALTFFTLTSCEKENFEESSKELKTKGFKILSYSSAGTNGRSVVNNILSFETEEDFYITLDSLQNAYDIYSSDFTQSVAGMNDDDINQMIISQNIDLEQPLTDFENQYDFVSLRNKINQREQDWLNNPNPDFSKCPQIHSVATFAERCLWNENGEIMIAGRIHKYSDDDTQFITILDGDLEKLALLIIGDISVLSDPMVTVEDILPANISTTVTSTNTVNCATTSVNSIPFDHQGGAFRIVCSNRLKKKDWSHGKHVLSAGTVIYKWNYPNNYVRFARIQILELFGQRYNNCGSTPTAVTGLSKIAANSAISVELKRNYEISTKYSSDFSSINSSHGVSFGNSPAFNAILRLKY